MTLLELLILALVQGLTEFLPVSSSAHLELLHKIVGATDRDLSLDIAVHVGTLGAAMLYFRTEVGQAIAGFFRLLGGDRASPGAQLALNLIVATIPVVIVGGLIRLAGLAEALRSLSVIGWAMILFGALLYWMDRRGGSGKGAGEWTLRDAWIMGLWQSLAMIPGVSRSGVTITGALALGYERAQGARLAMLMSIPTIIASGTLLGYDVYAAGDLAFGRDVAYATAMAFVAGLAALALMMRLLKSVNFTPYVIYRFGLGAVILWFAYA